MDSCANRKASAKANAKVFLICALLSSLLLAVAGDGYAREDRKSPFKLDSPKLNLGLLTGRANLDAAIVLTKVPGGLFIDGDSKDQQLVEWEGNVQCSLRYASKPGSRVLLNYPNTLQAQGAGQLLLNPANEGLRTGVYYCILVSESDPNQTSVEFKVIVSANAVPIPRAPLGSISVSAGAPLFRWDPVEGVPYYALFVSEGPIAIERDEDGEVTGLSGLNLVWQVITSSTFIRYGDADPTGNFANAHVPPLFPGIEYNWIVLNAYAPGPDFVSGEVAPVAPSFFDVTRPLLSQVPLLAGPPADAEISDGAIHFEWSPVAGVSRYRLFLYETADFSDNTIEYTLWSRLTTDTQISLPARDLLVRTAYRWRVVAEDGSRISTSVRRSFQYTGPAGWSKFIVDSREGPLSRVSIEIKNEIDGSILLPAVTDTFGFAKQALPVGIYSVTASRPGFLTSERREVNVPNNDTLFVPVELERSTTSIAGQVVNGSGAPIFDATVQLTSGSQAELVSSDFDGYFWSPARPANWSLEARKLGYVRSDAQTVLLDDDEARDVGQIVLQEATNVVSGQVIFSGDSRPFPGAFVRAASTNASFETTTNNQGGFRFELGPGSWTISLNTQGFYATPPEYRYELTENRQVPASFQLSPGGIVLGKVSYQNLGLADATVRAFRRDNGELVQKAISNVQGDYSLGLPAGEYVLTASRKNFLEVRRDITVPEGATSVEDFTLTEAGFVKGAVTSLDTFQPVEGATVVVLEDTTISAVSGANGKYVLSLPPDQTFQIDAFLNGFDSNGPFSVTAASGDTAVQDIFLKASSGVIQGEVTDGFQPVAGALVEVRETGSQEVTDSEGRFRFETVPGNYILEVSKDCHFSSTVSVMLTAGETQDLKIALEALQSIITGRVTSTNGDLVANAEVVAAGDTLFSTFTDVSGRYGLCLNGGIFRVTASAAGYLPADTTLVISDGDSLGGINFVLAENFATLSGTVRDTLDLPVSFAVVTLSNPDQTVSDTTDVNGIYLIEKIIPGLADIRGSKSGFYGGSITRFFQGMQQENLDIILFPSDGFIAGTVYDAHDSTTGIDGVAVSAQFSADSEQFFNATTDAFGSYRITDLPVVPGTTYQLFAFKEGFFTPTPLDRIPVKSVGVDFYLIDKVGMISGTVQDVDTAEPVENARVEAVNSSGGRSVSFTDSDGAFDIGGLIPTDVYRLNASRSGFFSQAVLGVTPGDSTVVISLTRRYGFVRGQIRDFGTDAGLDSIRVLAIPSGPEGRTVWTETGPNGEYELRLIAGGYTVQPVISHRRSDPPFSVTEVAEVDTVFGVDFTLERQSVQSISVQRADQGERPSISNAEVHCYNASARDPDNRPVTIGLPKWTLNVSRSAAMIDAFGCISFNPSYFGDLMITATDSSTGKDGTLSVQVFAAIDANTEAVLFDDRGLQLDIRSNTVTSKKDMFVSKEPLAPAKRGRAEIFTMDSSYVIKPAGLVFNKPAKLVLPPPGNTSGQQIFIAKWDGTRSEWMNLATSENGSTLHEANILETGEYVSLAISKPLQIENLSLLPNPFSPFQEVDGRSGLRIEFDVSSNAAPNPLLSLKVYNLEGNLVRVLHDQTPFPRGHARIYWDGKSDNGALARNGRYLVRFLLEDPAERREALRAVVLIK